MTNSPTPTSNSNCGDGCGGAPKCPKCPCNRCGKPRHHCRCNKNVDCPFC